jgi:hypothetical protein
MVLISIDVEDKEEIDAIGREIAAKRNVKGVSYAEAVKMIVQVYRSVYPKEAQA